MIQSLMTPNHQFIQQIVDALPVGVVLIDLEGRILAFNLMAEHISGYAKDEIIGQLCSNLGFRDCPMPCPFFTSSARHNPRLMQSSCKHKEGHRISVLRGIYPLKNDHGKLIGALETLLDDDWHKRFANCQHECAKMLSLERAREIHLRNLIERSKNKLLGIFDEIIDGLFMIDHDYKIKAINKTQASYLNKIPKALIESYCYQVIADREIPCPDCRAEQVFREGVTRTDLNIKVKEDLRCPGNFQDKRRYVNIHYIPIKTELGQVHNVLIYTQDISKIKALEEEVRRTENLAGLGILASGMAHEINNPLQVILSGANCLIKGVDSRELVLEMADQIKECAEKMANIIRDLSLYSRGIREQHESSPIFLQKVLDASLSMASHVRNMKMITVERDYQTEGMVLGNDNQFQQIFVNLIINAIDAMQGMGKITIRLGQDNGVIWIQIEDTGCGIPEQDLPYIFDPFFTTKAPGKGTGLGLNVVYRLVNQYQGKIVVETKEAKGTLFTLKFPKHIPDEVKNCDHEAHSLIN